MADGISFETSPVPSQGIAGSPLMTLSAGQPCPAPSLCTTCAHSPRTSGRHPTEGSAPALSTQLALLGPSRRQKPSSSCREPITLPGPGKGWPALCLMHKIGTSPGLISPRRMCFLRSTPHTKHSSAFVSHHPFLFECTITESLQFLS